MKSSKKSSSSSSPSAAKRKRVEEPPAPTHNIVPNPCLVPWSASVWQPWIIVGESEQKYIVLLNLHSVSEAEKEALNKLAQETPNVFELLAQEEFMVASPWDAEGLKHVKSIPGGWVREEDIPKDAVFASALPRLVDASISLGDMIGVFGTRVGGS